MKVWRGWARICGAALMAAWAGLAVAQATAPAAAKSATQNGAQTSLPTKEQPVTTLHTQANLVIVDVVVRDKGNPIRGLKQGDFHILENGKEQKITVFEEHKATDALQVSTAPQLPPNVYSDTPQYTMTSAANVLLLDAMNTPYTAQVLIRKAMVDDLRTIPDGTQIAVFKLDAKLHIISGFTSDKGAIAKLLEKGPGLAEPSPVMDPHFTEALSQLSNLAGGAGATTSAQQNMQEFAQQQSNFQGNLQGESTMDAFTQLARYLSTIPGRKNLIWYTGTVPFSFPNGSTATNSSMGSTMDMADFSGQMQRMLELLTVARVAVYPVDSRGLVSNAHAWDHLHMDQIAQVTGGKAIYETNAVGAALPEAIANGSDYYTLGYSPLDQNYNGALRSIAVKMDDNAHYDLEYRRGYFAIDPTKEQKLMAGRTSPLIDAMQHGSLELSQVIFDVRVLPEGDPEVKSEPVTPGPAGMVTRGLSHPHRYMVDYWIDPRGVEGKALPNGGQQREIEVTQVAYDDEGIRANYTDVPFEVTMTASEAQQALRDGIPLHQQIDLPKGKGFLRVAVHDLESGRIGTVEIPVDAGK